MADNEYNTGSYGGFTGTYTTSGSYNIAIGSNADTGTTTRTFSTQGFQTGRISDAMRQKQAARIRLLDTLNKL